MKEIKSVTNKELADLVSESLINDIQQGELDTFEHVHIIRAKTKLLYLTRGYERFREHFDELRERSDVHFDEKLENEIRTSLYTTLKENKIESCEAFRAKIKLYQVSFGSQCYIPEVPFEDDELY